MLWSYSEILKNPKGSPSKRLQGSFKQISETESANVFRYSVRSDALINAGTVAGWAVLTGRGHSCWPVITRWRWQKAAVLYGTDQQPRHWHLLWRCLDINIYLCCQEPACQSHSSLALSRCSTDGVLHPSCSTSDCSWKFTPSLQAVNAIHGFLKSINESHAHFKLNRHQCIAITNVSANECKCMQCKMKRTICPSGGWSGATASDTRFIHTAKELWSASLNRTNKLPGSGV